MQTKKKAWYECMELRNAYSNEYSRKSFKQCHKAVAINALVVCATGTQQSAVLHSIRSVLSTFINGDYRDFLESLHRKSVICHWATVHPKVNRLIPILHTELLFRLVFCWLIVFNYDFFLKKEILLDALNFFSFSNTDNWFTFNSGDNWICLLEDQSGRKLVTKSGLLGCSKNFPRKKILILTVANVASNSINMYWCPLLQNSKILYKISLPPCLFICPFHYTSHLHLGCLEPGNFIKS